MGIAAVAAVFATENVIDILISKYVQLELEIATWVVIGIIAALIIHEVGEDRGDW